MNWCDLQPHVLTQADADNVSAYISYFKLTPPHPIVRAIYEFNENDLSTKENLGLEFMKWIASDPHFLEDKLWERPRQKAREILILNGIVD